MRFVCKTKIEKAWIAASVSIFVLHQLLEASSYGYHAPGVPLMAWLEVSMVALSFPLGGLTLFVIQDAMFWCDGCRNLEWMFNWPTLLFAGYIQWFWLLPEFLRRRKLTLLNLNSPPETITPNASPALAEPPAHAPSAAALNAALDAAPRHAFDAADFTLVLAEFDEAGLTALGRVFQAQDAPPARASSSAQVETIFPRVS